MKDITPVEPVNEPGVQAADVVAYLWYRVLLGSLAYLRDDEKGVYAASIASRQGVLMMAGPKQLQNVLNMHSPEDRQLWASLRFR